MIRFIMAYLAWAVAAQAGPDLRLDSNLVWRQSEQWFGGWSGAEVSKDGQTLTVISDKGRVLQADLLRNGGVLGGLQVRQSAPLLSPKRSPLKNKRTDAEGLAIDADGNTYISFEQFHRVMRLDPVTGRTTALKRLPAGMKFQKNSGLEALAISPQGEIYTLPERSGAEDRPFPLFVLRGDQWQVAAHIPRSGPFLPVGADFGPQGFFWLLERAATPLGFRTRIRRFDLDRADLGEVTLLSTWPGRYDNHEAISVWQDPAGHTRVLIISDDNFLAIQRTQILEFTLTE